MKDNFDEILDKINKKYWTNIKNIVLKYDWNKIPKK